MRRNSKTPDHGAEAAALAKDGLIFLAEDPDRLGAFLAVTGTDPRQIRAMADDPQFLAAVLDHIRSQEPLAADFCQSRGTTSAALAAAALRLGGGTWERDVP